MAIGVATQITRASGRNWPRGGYKNIGTRSKKCVSHVFWWKNNFLRVSSTLVSTTARSGEFFSFIDALHKTPILTFFDPFNYKKNKLFPSPKKIPTDLRQQVYPKTSKMLFPRKKKKGFLRPWRNFDDILLFFYILLVRNFGAVLQPHLYVSIHQTESRCSFIFQTISGNYFARARGWNEKRRIAHVQ